MGYKEKRPFVARPDIRFDIKIKIEEAFVI